jgi:hypothetical protein
MCIESVCGADLEIKLRDRVRVVEALIVRTVHDGHQCQQRHHGGYKHDTTHRALAFLGGVPISVFLCGPVRSEEQTEQSGVAPNCTG